MSGKETSRGARLARGLTLSRLFVSPVFLWLFFRTTPQSPAGWGFGLVLLYVYIVSTDLLDGPLARRAGLESSFWGKVDAAADIVFNSACLFAAAWLGRVGVWVPLGALMLGGGFMYRCLRAGLEPSENLPEDWAGKGAGVLLYLLVGLIVAAQILPWEGSDGHTARAGDLVFLYCLFLLIRNGVRARRG